MNNIKIRRFAASSAPFLSGTVAILLAIAIVASPEASLAASLQGLKLWWTLVFPALLPFLILSEMLTASGFVHGFGVLLEPLMTKVFRLPGSGGWTLALGMTAGFPAGATGVMQLHKQGSLTDKEARRLASLAHFASPVTVLTVIGVAFLHSPAAGYSLLAIHWLSGLLAGFTEALLNGRAKNTPVTKIVSERPSLYHRVPQAITEARMRDGRSFGKLLGESVASAVQNLMIVGGYMIMFAVIIQIVISLFPQLSPVLPASFMELHLGTKALSAWTASVNGPSTSDLLGAALLSGTLGWSGLCAQLQSLTVLKQAGVRFLPYAAVRLLHGLYAALLTLLVWKPLSSLQEAIQPVLAGPDTEPTVTVTAAVIWRVVPQLLSLQSCILLGLLLLSMAVYLATAIRRRSA